MLTQKEYVEQVAACPYCENTEYNEWGQFEGQDTLIKSHCSCSKCGKKWTEWYKLDGYTTPDGEPDPPEDKE